MVQSVSTELYIIMPPDIFRIYFCVFKGQPTVAEPDGGAGARALDRACRGGAGTGTDGGHRPGAHRAQQGDRRLRAGAHSGRHHSRCLATRQRKEREAGGSVGRGELGPGGCESVGWGVRVEGRRMYKDLNEEGE